MPAFRGQTGNHGLGIAGRHQILLGQTVTHDLAVGLDVEPPAPDRDSGPAFATRLETTAEPAEEIGLPIGVGISQCDDIAPLRNAPSGVVR
jgi:hypothetical protein